MPGDTFRAAAAEQLKEWAGRSGAVMGEFQDKAKPQKVRNHYQMFSAFFASVIVQQVLLSLTT